MGERVVQAEEKHEAAFQEMCALLGRHNVDAENMLAIASNMVGKLLALQDQRTMSRERALQIIQANIEKGNAQILQQIKEGKMFLGEVK